MDQGNAKKIKPMHITSEESVEDMVILFSHDMSNTTISLL